MGQISHVTWTVRALLTTRLERLVSTVLQPGTHTVQNKRPLVDE